MGYELRHSVAAAGWGRGPGAGARESGHVTAGAAVRGSARFPTSETNDSDRLLSHLGNYEILRYPTLANTSSLTYDRRVTETGHSV